MATAPVILDRHGRPIAQAQIRQAGFRRARAQAAMGAFLAGSGNAPELRDWTPAAGSPDADLDGDRQTIVARARDLERNDALVSGAVQSLKDSAIGFGLDFQSMPDYRALGIGRDQAQDAARRIESIWHEWSEDRDACDVTGQLPFGAMLRQSVQSDLVAGESLQLALWLPERQRRLGSRFATVMQTVEADRLSNPQDRIGDPRLRDGVEIDGYGAPVAYHIRSSHPGDLFMPWAMAAADWQRVPLRGPGGRRVVIHSFDQKRPGQHRGVSVFAPVMTELKQRARFQRAELQAAVVNAVIAAVLETPADGQTLLDLFGDANSYMDMRNTQPSVQLGIGPGGAIPRLLPGESLKGYSSNRPSAGMDGFVTTVSRLIATGIGMTYETFMRDFSKTNYSSARASLLEGWRFVLFLRMHKTLTWCRPTLDLVLEEAVWRGYLDLPGFSESRARRQAWLRGVWRGPARGWVDPVKEITAAAMRVRLGISTLRDEALDQGRDLDDLLDQIALEQEALKARGLTLPEVNFMPTPDQPEPAAAGA